MVPRPQPQVRRGPGRERQSGVIHYEFGARTTRPSKAVTRAKRPVSNEPRFSRTRQPEDASAEAWQAGLRRQFGRKQAFELTPLVAEPVFSEFVVSNP
jgi:hypothetical protein